MSGRYNRLATPVGLTKADLEAIVRWFRSAYGPLAAEIESGSLTTEDGDALTLRRLLQILDGPESGVRRIDIFGAARSVKEIRALLSTYRRACRAARRIKAESAREWRREVVSTIDLWEPDVGDRVAFHGHVWTVTSWGKRQSEWDQPDCRELHLERIDPGLEGLGPYDVHEWVDACAVRPAVAREG